MPWPWRCRREPAFPAYLRDEQREVIKPLDVDFGPGPRQCVIMACLVMNCDEYQMIEWWGRTQAAAMESFDEWLGRDTVTIDRPFRYTDPAAEPDEVYSFRPRDVVKEYIAVPGPPVPESHDI